jgi:hypothetical protein
MSKSELRVKLGLDPDAFAQQLRRAHCAHAEAQDPDHVCVGECTIRRGGVDLDCPVCGPGGEPLEPPSYKSAAVRRIFAAVGIDWTSLTLEARRAAVTAYEDSLR